jgi:hypothetical protein
MRNTLPCLAALLVLTLAGPAALSDEFSIDWHTIDAGGAMFSVGGTFELGGTIGQPDATPTTMAGGEYTLAGGFWAAVTCAPDLRPGDANCDGVVSAADIDPFVIALTQGQAAYEAQFPDCAYLSADCNDDGVVTAADIDPFVQLLISGG